MRSAKSRSRSKGNRSRSIGNVVNRVFDSSGPEGKVRGTPQQIIEKYTQLARDAQLANDRVAAENFQQHAEHYTRMLGEALREQESRREQPEPYTGQQQGRPRDRGADGEGMTDPGAEPQPDAAPPRPRREGGRDHGRDFGRDAAPGEYDADVIDLGEEPGASTLVETPETVARPSSRSRPRPAASETADGDAPALPAEEPRAAVRHAPRARTARPDPEAPASGATAPEATSADTAGSETASSDTAAQAPAPRAAPRRPRRPRTKPEAATQDAAQDGEKGPASGGAALAPAPQDAAE